MLTNSNCFVTFLFLLLGLSTLLCYRHPWWADWGWQQ